ncbi:MAG: DUF2461 domain-containing protein [Saprospiraceae bacterium]|nr:DUF2461 domain-containing protein [Saprospiraceae bacterium]
MQYFTEAYNDFFKGLAPNNNKDWFDVHRKDYEKHVKKPMHKFVEALIAAVQKEEPKFDLLPRQAIFRVNRDIRFSKDKTPYKLHMSAVIAPNGRKSILPGMYVHIGVGEVMIGGGLYNIERKELMKIREGIMQDPSKVDVLLEDKTFRHYYPKGIQGNRNKVLPKIFKSTAQTQPLIYNKQFYYMRTYEDEQLISQANFLDFCMEHYHASKAWNRFLTSLLVRKKTEDE